MASAASSLLTPPVHSSHVELHAHLRTLRQLSAQRLHTPAAWLAGQVTNGVTPAMRRAVVHYILREAVEWRLHTDTLHMAVSVFDRFVGCEAAAFPGEEETGVPLSTVLRVVALTCMWVATKMCETDVMTVRQLVGAAVDGGAADARVSLKARDFIDWEAAILRHLDYRLRSPTAYEYVGPLSTLLGLDAVHSDTAAYLIDLLLDDVTFLQFPPERAAWAALWIATALVPLLPSASRSSVPPLPATVTDADENTSLWSPPPRKRARHHADACPPVVIRIDPAQFSAASLAARRPAPIAPTRGELSATEVAAEVAYIVAHALPAHRALAVTDGLYRAYGAEGHMCSPPTKRMTGTVGLANVQFATAV